MTDTANASRLLSSLPLPLPLSLQWPVCARTQVAEVPLRQEMVIVIISLGDEQSLLVFHDL